MADRKRIILVGNAPIMINEATINGYDFVIQFNSCPNIANDVVVKTDVVCITNGRYPTQEMLRSKVFDNKILFQSIKAVYIPTPNGGERLPDKDYPTDRLINHFKPKGIPVIQVDVGFYNDIRAEFDANGQYEKLPSTGFIALRHILASGIYDDWEIHMVGFTFEGWYGHSWDYEKEFVKRMVNDGRVIFHENSLS